MSRTCFNCKYEHLDESANPCKVCFAFKKWEPKEDDMGEKTFTMTFTADRINEETLKTITGETEGEDDLQAKLDGANEKIKDLQDKVNSARLACAWKNGEIEGLHYAIRHFAKGARKK